MVKLQKLEEKVQMEVGELEEILNSIQPDLNKLNRLHTMLYYLEILADAQETRFNII